MDTSRLVEEIEKQFGSGQSKARRIAEKASEFAEYAENDPEGWEGPSKIDVEYVISQLQKAPEDLSVTAKWDWWAGSIDYLGSPDFRIN